MEKVFLDKTNQFLSVFGVSGHLVVSLDSNSPIRMPFHQMVKIYFDLKVPSPIKSNEIIPDVKNLQSQNASSKTFDSATALSVSISNFDFAADGEDRLKLRVGYRDPDDLSTDGRETSTITNNSTHECDTAAMSPTEVTEDGSRSLEKPLKSGRKDSLLKIRTEQNLWPLDFRLPESLFGANEVLEALKGMKNDGTLSIGSKDSNFSCLFCNSAFCTQFELMAHHRVVESITHCENCGMDFLCECDLFIHHYVNYDHKFVSSHYPTFKILDRDQCMKNQCALCGWKLSTQICYYTHLQSVHFKDLTYRCCVCGKLEKCYDLLISHLKKDHKRLTVKRRRENDVLNSNSKTAKMEISSDFEESSSFEELVDLKLHGSDQPSPVTISELPECEDQQENSALSLAQTRSSNSKKHKDLKHRSGPLPAITCSSASKQYKDSSQQKSMSPPAVRTSVASRQQKDFQGQKSCFAVSVSSNQGEILQNSSQMLAEKKSLSLNQQEKSHQQLSSPSSKVTAGRAKSRKTSGIKSTVKSKTKKLYTAFKPHHLIKPCQYCNRSFESYDDKKEHTEGSAAKIKAICPKCTLTFSSQAALLVHDYVEHDGVSGEDNYKEPKVGKPKDLDHCPVCSKKLSGKNIVAHICEFHTKEALYRCCICEEELMSKRMLAKHLKRHVNPEKFRRGLFRCSHCPQIFSDKGEFSKHAHTHRTMCVFCKKDFGHILMLEAHYKAEHTQEMLTCSECGKKVATKVQMYHHLRHHRYKKPHPCPVCGIMLVRNYSVHIETMHPDFADSNMVEEKFNSFGHILQDDFSSPTQISKLTSSVSDVLTQSNTAVLTTSNSTSDQQRDIYLCSQCPKTFPNKRRLRIHLKKHEDEGIRWPCPQCDKTYSDREQLSRHIRGIHLKNTNFKCEVCGKLCNQKSNLRIHMRKHLTEKLFHCNICDRGFNYKASLKGHMKSRHNLEVDSATMIHN